MRLARHSARACVASADLAAVIVDDPATTRTAQHRAEQKTAEEAASRAGPTGSKRRGPVGTHRLLVLVQPGGPFAMPTQTPESRRGGAAADGPRRSPGPVTSTRSPRPRGAGHASDRRGPWHSRELLARPGSGGWPSRSPPVPLPATPLGARGESRRQRALTIRPGACARWSCPRRSRPPVCGHGSDGGDPYSSSPAPARRRPAGMRTSCSDHIAAGTGADHAAGRQPREPEQLPFRAIQAVTGGTGAYRESEAS